MNRLKYALLMCFFGTLGTLIWVLGPATTAHVFVTGYDEVRDRIAYYHAPEIKTHVPGTHPLTSLAWTFDDGEKSARLATDELEKHGIRSTQFIITESTETNPWFHLTLRDIRKLYARKHEMGSHTGTHIDLMPEKDRAKVWREINDSRIKLADMLGAPLSDIASFAAPRGLYARDEIEMIEQAGYTYAVTAFGDGPNFDTLNPYVLVRYDIQEGRSPEEVCAFIDKAIMTREEVGEPALIILAFHFFLEPGQKAPTDIRTGKPNTLYVSIESLKHIVQCVVARRDKGELFTGTLSQAIAAYQQHQTKLASQERN